jgi:hypothetical protein
MTYRMRIALSFTAGMSICAALTVFLDRPSPELAEPVRAEPGQPLGAMPRCREHAAVLSWIFEHRVDAASLEFLTWSDLSQVPENPFSNGPATLVKLVVKNKSAAAESVEHLAFYLHNLEVLGSLSQPYVNVKAVVCV